jgi:hypothetical protein
MQQILLDFLSGLAASDFVARHQLRNGQAGAKALVQQLLTGSKRVRQVDTQVLLWAGIAGPIVRHDEASTGGIEHPGTPTLVGTNVKT